LKRMGFRFKDVGKVSEGERVVLCSDGVVRVNPDPSVEHDMEWLMKNGKVLGTIPAGATN